MLSGREGNDVLSGREGGVVQSGSDVNCIRF